jgi:hypothetical protein
MRLLMQLPFHECCILSPLLLLDAVRYPVLAKRIAFHDLWLTVRHPERSEGPRKRSLITLEFD